METDGRDNIDGPNGGSATWEGTFVGHHTAAGANGADSTAQDYLGATMGEEVSADVELEVTFVKDKGAQSLVATIDDFSTKLIEDLEVTFGTDDAPLSIGRGASFDSETATVVGTTVIADTTDTTGEIDGQFYGPGGVEAGGTLMLENGGTSTATNPTFSIKGGFGAENR